MDGCSDGRIHGWTDAWTNRRMDEWTNGWTDERTNEMPNEFSSLYAKTKKKNKRFFSSRILDLEREGGEILRLN